MGIGDFADSLPLVKSTGTEGVMILGLRTCLVCVRPEQLDSAKAWYAAVMGVSPYFDQPFYVGFNVGGFELGIDPNDGEPGPGGVLVYWGTPDVAAEVERLVGLGAAVAEAVKDVGDGIKVATLTDPFGNRLGLIENPHFDSKAVK